MAQYSFTLDARHDMYPRLISIDGPAMQAALKVGDFAKLRKCWFPAKFAYLEIGKNQDYRFCQLVEVLTVNEYDANAGLTLEIARGTIVNDDMEDHDQIKLDEHLTLTLDGLPELHSRASVPETVNFDPPVTGPLTWLWIAVPNVVVVSLLGYVFYRRWK